MKCAICMSRLSEVRDVPAYVHSNDVKDLALGFLNFVAWLTLEWVYVLILPLAYDRLSIFGGSLLGIALIRSTASSQAVCSGGFISTRSSVPSSWSKLTYEERR